jgi:hypothetical protein
MPSGYMRLADIRTAARQRADMESSQFVTDAELTSYINQSLFELYDILVQAFGNDYYVADPYEFTTEAATTRYPLPTGPDPQGVYKVLGVDLQQSGSATGWLSLQRFNFAERNAASAAVLVLPQRTNLRYRLAGDDLMLSPPPPAGLTLRVWYVPRMAPLADDDDLADGVSGWVEYAICDAAIKCLQKEESDVSVLLAQKLALVKRIQAAAENRDAGSPATVSDVLGGADGWGDC